MTQIRVTQRSGRVGSAKHNDRSFLDGRNSQEVAPHIDTSKSDGNSVASWDGEKNLEVSEKNFYEKRYKQACDLRNARYIHEGHKDRCKTPEDLWRGRLTRPEELILQVGDMHAHVSAEDLKVLAGEYIQEFNKWNNAHGNHGHILSMSLHTDEKTPHVHIRRVWDYEKNGVIELGQDKALKEAGIPLPDPNKKPGRYNNRKMTFDSMMRGIWQDICKKNGLDIETEPRLNVRHKDKVDYISEQINKELKDKKAQIKHLKHDIEDLQLERDILSSAEVKNISQKAKTNIFDKVTLDKSDYEKLIQTASGNEVAMKEAKKGRNIYKNRQKILQEAEDTANKIIKDAQDKANSLATKIEDNALKSELKAYQRLEKEHPEVFKKMRNLNKNMQRVNNHHQDIPK